MTRNPSSALEARALLAALVAASQECRQEQPGGAPASVRIHVASGTLRHALTVATHAGGKRARAHAGDDFSWVRRRVTELAAHFQGRFDTSGDDMPERARDLLLHHARSAAALLTEADIPHGAGAGEGGIGEAADAQAARPNTTATVLTGSLHFDDGASGSAHVVARLVGITTVAPDKRVSAPPGACIPAPPPQGRVLAVRLAGQEHPAGQEPAAGGQAGLGAPSANPRGRYVMHFDGGARPNPGPGGAGVVLRQGGARADSAPMWSHSAYVGAEVTNNVAEYTALVAGLEYCASLGWRDADLHIVGDSELVVKQMTGLYKTSNPALVALRAKAQLHIASLNAARVSVSFEHVPREDNAEADALATRGRESRGEAATPPDRQASPAGCNDRPLGGRGERHGGGE